MPTTAPLFDLGLVSFQLRRPLALRLAKIEREAHRASLSSYCLFYGLLLPTATIESIAG
jgi:hypothetical protein